MEVDTAVPDTVQDVLCTSTPCFFTQHLHVIFKSSKHNGANLGGDSKLGSFKKKHKACLLLPPTNTPDSKNILFQISSHIVQTFPNPPQIFPVTHCVTGICPRLLVPFCFLQARGTFLESGALTKEGWKVRSLWNPNP